MARLGYDIKLGMIANGLCLTIVPLVTTLILSIHVPTNKV